jgi:hypothetical protein
MSSYLTLLVSVAHPEHGMAIQRYCVGCEQISGAVQWQGGIIPENGNHTTERGFND